MDFFQILGLIFRVRKIRVKSPDFFYFLRGLPRWNDYDAVGCLPDVWQVSIRQLMIWQDFNYSGIQCQVEICLRQTGI